MSKKLISDPSEMAEILSEQYSSIFSTPKNGSIPVDELFPDQIDAQVLILSIVPQTEVGLEQEETVQNPDIGCQVGRKRKSQMSYSVVGRDLRKKRRLNKAQNAPAVRRIQVEEITQESTQESTQEDEEITQVDENVSRWSVG